MSKIIKSVALHGKPKVITTPSLCIVKTPTEPDKENDTDTAKAAAENELLKAAKLEAEALLYEASIEASRCRSEAEQAIEALKNEAFHDGFQKGFSQGSQEGLAAGLEEAQSQISLARIQADEILQNAKQQTNKMYQTAEVQIIDIALTIARKVLKREIDENPMTILPIVKEALGKVLDQDTIVVRVNPDDIELLEHARRDLQNMIGGEKQLSIVADPGISPGGCMLDTKCGTVDASIDTQFAAIEQALKDMLP